MDQPTVLIISDEVDFSRRVTARWQMERSVPTFTMLSGDLWPRFAVDSFDIAIVGELRRELLSVVLEPLHSARQLCSPDSLRGRTIARGGIHRGT